MKKPTNTTVLAESHPGAMLADAIIFGGSNAIERQEARGQAELAESDTLPTDLRGVTRYGLEAAGVKFLCQVEDDPLFTYAVLPSGWKVVPTDHSMWSKLVDDKGRERASIFYKAAFYDRGAHMDVSRRYGVRFDYDHMESTGLCVAHVTDCGVPIFGTTALPKGEKYYEIVDIAEAKATAWLDEHFPNWKDPAAYWDAP